MDIIPELFILITAVVFTGLGFYIGQQNAVSDIAEAIIDSLIEDGYIRTRGKGENLTLLKHWEK
jgi:hypothetical protein